MVNWKYTLWKREYDLIKKTFVSKVSRGGTGSPVEGSLEQLAEHHYKNRRDSPDSITFDENDMITTIPAIVRMRTKGGYIDKPAEVEDILKFEEILDKKFNG